MNAVIVGCGRIAGGYNESDDTQVLSHVVALRRAGLPVAGCVDEDLARAKRFAERWAIPEFGSDVADMLRRTEARLVCDCTPARSRPVVLGAALAAPAVHTVIAEKPFAADEAAARLLLESCTRSGKRVFVNHQRAYDPCYRAIEEQVRSGMLGRIQWLVGHAYGGALNGLSHVLERAIAMLGPVRRAESIALPFPGPADDPPVAFAAEFESGGHGLFLPLESDGFAGVEFDLMGTKGRFRIVDSERRLEYFRSRPSTDPSCDGLQMLEPATIDIPAPDWEALRYVVEAAADETVMPACLPQLAADVVTVIDRVRRYGAYDAPGDANRVAASS